MSDLARTSAALMTKWFGSKASVKMAQDEVMTNNFEIFAKGKQGKVLVWSRMTRNHKILAEADPKAQEILKAAIFDMIAGKEIKDLVLPVSEQKEENATVVLSYAETKEKILRENQEAKDKVEADKKAKADRLAAVAAEKKAEEAAAKKAKKDAAAKKTKDAAAAKAKAAKAKKDKEDALKAEELRIKQEQEDRLMAEAQKQLEEEETRRKQEEEEKAKQLAAEEEAAAAAAAREAEAPAAAATTRDVILADNVSPEKGILVKKDVPAGFFAAFMCCANPPQQSKLDDLAGEPGISYVADDAMIGA